MDLGSNTVISGDGMSRQSARLFFSLGLCNTSFPLCPDPDDAWNKISAAGDLGVIIGTFEPFINNEQKKDPWNYAINTDNRVPLDSLVTASVNVYLKKLEAQTDYGRIIEDSTTEVRAAVKNVKMEFSSKLSLGYDMGNGGDYSMMISASDNFLNLNFVASRSTEVFSRSYDTILDLFGNIGGSVDFIIILFTLLFNWYENLSSTLIMRNALARKFNLPKRYIPSSSVLSLCNCKKKRDKVSEEVLDNMAESALNFERLAEEAAISSFTQKLSTPEELRILLPTVMFLEAKMKLMDEIEEEKKLKQMKKNKIDQSANTSQTVPLPMAGQEGESSQMITDTKRFKDENPMKKAYSQLLFSVDDENKLIRTQMIKIINEYCKRENISNPEDIFDEPITSSNKNSAKAQNLAKPPEKDSTIISPSPPISKFQSNPKDTQKEAIELRGSIVQRPVI